MTSSPQTSPSTDQSPASVENVRLIVVDGRASKQDVELKLPAIIGRGQGATVLIKHGTVSRTHCEISASGEALIVRDLNSKNGTFVGEARIVEAALKPGDRLTVGPLTFLVEYEVRRHAAENGKAPAEAAPSEPAKAVTDDDVVAFLFE